MKIYGSIIFSIGMISALVSSAPATPLWVYFFVSITMAAIGAIAVRISAGKNFTGDGNTYDKTGKSAGASYELLKEIHSRVYSLVRDTGKTKLYIEKTKSDIESVKELMSGFIMDREFLIKKYGAGKASNLLTNFASGERNISRAWSALVDGYPHEMIDSLIEAEIWLSGTIGIYRQLQNNN